MKNKVYFAPILISIFFVFLVNLIAYHLGADIDWDLLNYHFYNGYTFLHGKFISDSLQTFQSYLDPFLNSFCYLLIANFSPLFVNLIIASFQSIGIVLVFLLSLNFIAEVDIGNRYLISFLIALAAIFGPVFMSEIGGTMGDTLLAVFVILSAIFIVKALQGINNKKSLKLILIYTCFSGISVGIAAGLKLTNMVYVVGLFLSFGFVLIFIRELSLKIKILLLATLGFSMFISFTLIYAPVGIILYDNFKNPLFPYYNNIFKSKYLPYINFKDLRWIPTSFSQYLEIPFLLAIPPKPWHINPVRWIGMEIPFKTYFFAAIAIIFPFYIFTEFRKYITKRYTGTSYTGFYPKLLLVLFFIFSFITWEIVFAYYRYIAALEILAPLVLFVMITSLYKKKFFNISMGFLIVILSLLSYPYSNWGRLKPFPNSYFGVNKETFNKFDNSMIIVGNAPLGFVLPYFPSNDKIMAIPLRMPLTNKFTTGYFQQIKMWNKKIYYLSIQDPPDTKKAIQLLNQHKLLLDYNSCNSVKTNSFPIFLCQMKKVKVIKAETIQNLISQGNYYFTKNFDTLFNSSQNFLSSGQSLSNLYPQYLESHGYLDKSFG
ncbi:MAG: hypothetical protein QXH64_02850, partial [Nitrososphaeria archaeon]